VYGFPKSGMDKITDKKLQDFETAAKNAFRLTEGQLEKILKTGKYTEI
jgi:hypothetical protein